MRKNLLVMASAVIGLLMLNGCGSGGSSSSITENDYLGKIPGLHIDYSAEIEANNQIKKEKVIKLADDKDIAGLKSLDEEMKAWRTELDTKYKENFAAEVKKIVGRDVPVTYSADLRKSPELFYTIENAKMAEKDGNIVITVDIKARHDFSVPAYSGQTKTPACYGLKLADGRVIGKSMLIPIPLDTKELSYKAGQLLSTDRGNVIEFRFGLNAKDLVNFIGIEFITREDYNARNNK